jgi:predicted TIM-barrel fold metal-dependent hydrolase
MIIDFQHHYIPVQLAKKRGLYSKTGRTMLEEGGLPATTMHQRLYDLDLQLDDMAQAGIDLSVLSCLLGWSAPIEECRFINDDLAAIQEKYPRRFVGLAQAPILEGKVALDELRRAISDLGLHGVTITSQVGGLSLDSPKLYDFYEAVCALDVSVFVHPALVPTGYAHLKDYDLPRVLGREVDLTVATTRLIAGGIFDRYPNLKIVVAHFGGGIAAVKDRLVGKGYRFGTLRKILRRILRPGLFRHGRLRRRYRRAQLCAPRNSPGTIGFRQRLSAGLYRCEYGHRQGYERT